MLISFTNDKILSTLTISNEVFMSETVWNRDRIRPQSMQSIKTCLTEFVY